MEIWKRGNGRWRGGEINTEGVKDEDIGAFQPRHVAACHKSQSRYKSAVLWPDGWLLQSQAADWSQVPKQRSSLSSPLWTVKNTNTVAEMWVCHIAGVHFQFSRKVAEKRFNSESLTLFQNWKTKENI